MTNATKNTATTATTDAKLIDENAIVIPTTKEQVLELIGINNDSIENTLRYITETRYVYGKEACKHWCEVGRIAHNISKAGAVMGGAKKDNLSLVIGTELSANQFTYALKMYNDRDSITKWYVESKCSKHNPRTIFDAWNKRNDVPVVKTPVVKDAPKKDTTKTPKTDVVEDETPVVKDVKPNYLALAQSMTMTLELAKAIKMSKEEKKLVRDFLTQLELLAI